MNLSKDIQSEIKKIVKKLWPKVKLPEIVVTEPSNLEFGDYSCPVALSIGKLTQANPLDIAEDIKKQLGKIKYVEEITVTKPGFVNFVLDYQQLADDMLSKPQKVSAKSKANIIVEHTSVNPNKAAHIGHLRNACLGDSYARILKYLGHNIEIQNYIDDLGTQVADSVMAYKQFKDDKKDPGPNLDISSKPSIAGNDKWFWRAYAKINKEYEIQPELLKQREIILHEMETGKNADAKKIVDEMVTAHLATFKNFGIEYDLLVYEHDIINNHLWDKVFEDLKQRKLIVQPKSGENKGAWMVEFGDTERENKILVRENGLPTYTAKDLAYELWKFGLTEPMKGYLSKLKTVDKTITVIDERQSYPRKVIQDTMTRLGYTKQADSSIHLAYGVVKLTETAMKALGQTTAGKTTYSMSGRQGIGVIIDDVFELVKIKQEKEHKSPSKVAEKIAVGSIRYYMLKTRPLREIVFDFNDALKTDGNTGVYLQYAYARASHILMKADVQKTAKTPKDLNIYEKQLIKALAEMESQVLKASHEYDPSLICDYAHNLASTFAKFYETSPVLQSKDPIKSFRLGLVKQYKATLEQVLNLIGIPALPRI